MKIDFIGHGLNINNKLNVGDQLDISFKSQHFDNFLGFVAFVAISGVSKLLPSILRAKEKFKSVTFFVGVDNKGTSKEALEMLLENEIETYIFHKSEEQITYHPKLFVFEGESHSRILLGSSNLTYSGFLNNIEATVQLDFRTKTDSQGKKILSEIKQYFSGLIDKTDKNVFRLSSELIEKYNNEGLLYSQFSKDNKEFQPNDGENAKDETSNIPFYNEEFGNGMEPNVKEPFDKNRSIKIIAKDYEVFEYFLERYKIYRRDVRNTGAVNKETDDYELLIWYQRVKELLRYDALPEDLILQLIDVDFPLQNGWDGLIKKFWEDRFSELLMFKENEQKDLNFTYVTQTKNKESKYYSLGAWCARQKLRRKGVKTPIWTDYEEQKMKSINYLFEIPDGLGLGAKPKDNNWANNLVELEEYYDNVENFKTIPNQKTKLGRWVNDQISLKLTGSRTKNKIFLNPIREALLGDLFSKNGIEWKWQEQKEREAIIEGLSKWQEWKVWHEKIEVNKLSDTEKKYNKEIQQWASQIRFRTKKWEQWKLDILIKAGFQYANQNE